MAIFIFIKKYLWVKEVKCMEKECMEKEIYETPMVEEIELEESFSFGIPSDTGFHHGKPPDKW